MTNESNFQKVTKMQKEEMIMASRSSNRAAVPEEQNGSVGGYMVKKMIEQQEKQMAGK